MSVTPPRHRPFPPLFVLYLTCLGGIFTGATALGWYLYDVGRRSAGIGVALAGVIVGIVEFTALFLWNLDWYLVAVVAIVLHLLAGIAMTVVAWMHDPSRLEPIAELPERGGYREVLAGISIGGSVTMLAGGLAYVLFLLMEEYLFQSYMIIDFDDIESIVQLIKGTVSLTILGSLGGGIIGRMRPRTVLTDVPLMLAAAVSVRLGWRFIYDLSISIPQYLARNATESGVGAAYGMTMMIEILMSAFWCVPLVLLLAPESPAQRRLAARWALIGTWQFASVITLIIVVGWPAATFLAAGIEFERKGYPERSIWCYEQGLKKNPNESSASYLQYRTALLQHKLGRHDLAKKGFERVVAKYNRNSERVAKSQRLLDAMERRPDGIRKVLPGVDYRMEARGASCAPNSMALVMNFWGHKTSARKIGKAVSGLNTGTFPIDQLWLAEKEKFAFRFLPMAGLDDIKHCIDAGFPAMVIVPGHVFVIFGYDEALETFVTFDTATADVWEEYPQKYFVKSWKRADMLLILTYPPAKEGDLPANVRERLQSGHAQMRANFQTWVYNDTPTETRALWVAAGEKGDFFEPVLALERDADTRKEVAEKLPVDRLAATIERYFGEDYDEGTHLWGQINNSNVGQTDQGFQDAMVFLHRHGHAEAIERVVQKVRTRGPISDSTWQYLGMVDLAQGNLQRAVERLSAARKESSPNLYLGLAKAQLGDSDAANREIAEYLQGRAKGIANSARGSTGNFMDDSFAAQSLRHPQGVADLSVARRFLLQASALGEQEKPAEEALLAWSHFLPFDTETQRRLAGMYVDNIETLEAGNNSEAHQRLTRRRESLLRRVSHYDRLRRGESTAAPSAIPVVDEGK